MRIIVDGKEAVLKAGSSFEYISENPLFTEAEGYSLEIEFPLKDCPENILIFGALHVQGVDLSRITFPCELDAGTFRKTGFLTIVEVNEVEVKGQFLEGMSTERFYEGAMNAYIDELDYTPIDGSDGVDAHIEKALGTGWENLSVWDKDKEDIFGGDWPALRHIYLYNLLDFISETVGVSFDYSVLPWWFRKLVVCNTTNFVNYVTGWGQYRGKAFMQLGKTMPHWTVKQLLQEIGKLFGCLVRIDPLTAKAEFVPANSFLDSTDIKEMGVVDEFEVESQDESGDYLKPVSVKLPDECNPDNINVCPWILEPSVQSMVEVRGKLSDQQYSTEYAATHNQDVSMVLKDTALYKLYDQYNLLAGYIAFTEIEERSDLGTADKEHFIRFELLDQCWSDPNGEDLKVVPCDLQIKRIKRHFYNKWYKITAAGEYEQTDSPISIPFKLPVVPIKGMTLDQLYGGGYSAADVRKAKDGVFEESYDKLYVVIHSGTFDENGYHLNTRKWEPEFGTVYAQGTIDATDGDVPTYHTGFRNYGATITPYSNEVGGNFFRLPTLDETQLYRFKFLGTTIPSPTSVFLINGQKFACLRITAHFTPSGMSELLEGEFYRIID